MAIHLHVDGSIIVDTAIGIAHGVCSVCSETIVVRIASAACNHHIVLVIHFPEFAANSSAKIRSVIIKNVATWIYSLSNNKVGSTAQDGQSK